MFTIMLILLIGGCASVPNHRSPPVTAENIGHIFAKSFLKSRFVTHYPKRHQVLRVDFLKLKNYSPRVIRVMGILKGGFEQTLEDSGQVTVVSGSRESRTIASEERLYQMSHARTSEIHSPGRQLGADVAIIGSVGCSTIVANRAERVFLYHLKAIDLSDNAAVWNHTVTIPVRLTKKLNVFQRVQVLRSLQYNGDPCQLEKDGWLSKIIRVWIERTF